MKYLIVYAHPEATSLSGHLKTRAVQALQNAGHEVVVSDLYAAGWKAAADRHDFLGGEQHEAPVEYSSLSRAAFANGTQMPEVEEEQRRLLWADVVILQFPIWWYGMPAILKGWVDRVYAYGFAYGIGPPRRRAMGQAVRRRNACGTPGHGGDDRRRANGPLWPARGQRRNGRRPLANPARRVVLPRLHGHAAHRLL